MFLNGMYTDDYICRVLFRRQAQPSLPVKNISLELENFNADGSEEQQKPWI